MVTWDDDETVTTDLLRPVALPTHLMATDLDKPVHNRIVLIVKWSIVVIPALMVFTMMRGVMLGIMTGLEGLAR
jgi:hypothetical protein